MTNISKLLIASLLVFAFTSEVHAVCVSVPEMQMATLSCPLGQTVNSIRFASYGTATGSCGGYATSSCNATNSTSFIANACLGKAKCSVLATNSIFGDPCGGIAKSLKVDYTCAAPLVSSVCGNVPEGQSLNLSCPAGQSISKIAFANYGTSLGSCGSFSTSSCRASNSSAIVSNACIGKTNCSILAGNSVFGDPCPGTSKSLAAQVHCSSSPKAYYLSPSGNDKTGTGTFNNPWFTLRKAWGAVQAGDVIYLRKGTYRYDSTQNLENKKGTENHKIKIWAYPGEKPKISPSDIFTAHRGIHFTNAHHVHIKGLEIAGFVQRDSISFYYGISAHDSSFNTFENLNVHDNGFGLSIGANSGDNLVLNSDFHRNSDPLTSFAKNFKWGGADGITIRTTDPARKNTIRGCRMWWNSDDGVDLYDNEGTIIIENSWAFWNGYQPGTFTDAGDGNGLKIGPTATDQTTKIRKILRNNLVFQNRLRGVDQNDNRSITHLYNNTSYANGFTGDAARGFDFHNGTAATIARNNIAFGEAMGSKFNKEAILSNNTFHGDATSDLNYGVSASDFLSLDNKGVTGPRQSNGGLPILNFLRLAPNSRLIDAGTRIGLPFNGLAPDLGAFESR